MDGKRMGRCGKRPYQGRMETPAASHAPASLIVFWVRAIDYGWKKEWDAVESVPTKAG